MFANKRIAKLKILEIYETYSIIIKKGIMIIGTPSGKNKTKYFSRWKHIPIKLLPIKNANEKYKVRIKFKNEFYILFKTKKNTFILFSLIDI